MAFDKRVSVSAYMSTQIHSIRVDETAKRAWEVMEKHGVRHLPVLEAGKLVGLLSITDVVAASKRGKADMTLVSVEEICAPLAETAKPTDTLAKVAQTMASQGIGSVVVVDGDKPVGIFTAVDACRALADALA